MKGENIAFRGCRWWLSNRSINYQHTREKISASTISGKKKGKLWNQEGCEGPDGDKGAIIQKTGGKSSKGIKCHAVITIQRGLWWELEIR